MTLTSSKGLLAVLGFAFAVEGALYSAVTPILPLLSRRLDMSRSQAGVLLSTYSAGLVLGSLLCVLVLRRFNARDVAGASLLLLAASTATFAWAHHYELALSLRLVQGIAGGGTWTACITWLLRLYPIEQRGEALGLAVGPAMIGTIAGPAIGTVAVELGIRGPYTAVGILCAVAAAWLISMPKPPLHWKTERSGTDAIHRRRRLAVLGGVVGMTAGALVGLVNLAGPLVLVSAGAADRTAGVVFVLAAITTVFAARPLGIAVDRYGAAPAAATGMLVMALALPAFGAGRGVVLTGVCVIVLLVANNMSYIAAGALLTREGEQAGWSLSFVTAVSATVWGVGETVGALLAGVGLDVAGDLRTTAAGSATATAMLVAIIAVAACARKPVGTPPGHEQPAYENK